MSGGTLSVLYMAFVVIGQSHAQDVFTDPIECFSCIDRAENTTCGRPIDPMNTNIPTLQCRKGACIKWTFYQYGILYLERTCSIQLKMHLQLTDSCRKERDGNGYLCMCPESLCNSDSIAAPPFRTILLSIVVSFLHSFVKDIT